MPEPVYRHLGSLEFTDGVWRDMFEDAAGRQCVAKLQGGALPRSTRFLGRLGDLGDYWLLHVQYGRQVSHLKHFVDEGPEIDESEVAAGRLSLLVQADDLPQSHAGNGLNIGEVQPEPVPARRTDQDRPLLCQGVDLGLAQGVLVEVDDRHAL